MTEDEGFFSRWSRRKVQARTGAPVPEPVPAPAPAVAPTATAAVTAPAAPAAGSETAAPAEPPPSPPTLEDVQRLTPQADFRAFVRPEVAPEVRNAAFRKLFSDPHFNVMDGLDIYIDDYSQPNPLPMAMARQMVAAQFMKVFDAPEQTAPSPTATVESAADRPEPTPAADGEAPLAATAQGPDTPPPGDADTAMAPEPPTRST